MVGKTIHSKERALILKVLAFFEREKEVSKVIPVNPTKSAHETQEPEEVHKKFMIPFDQPINRTCAATGISKSTLMRIKKHVEQTQPRTALILKVLAFFEREKEMSKVIFVGVDVDPTKSAQETREHEKDHKKYIIPFDQPVNRTCAATGISKSTLMRIKKQVKQTQPPTSTSAPIPRPSTPGKKRKPSKQKINLDSSDLVALRNLINSFYTVRKEVPTLKKILAAAKEDLNFPGEYTTLRRILKNQLGFRFKKCKNA